MNKTRYNKADYVKSSPHFFRLIALAALVLGITLFCGSILLPAPLLGPANPGAAPNPAKSAWFLLWIQELVSHGNFLVYPVIAVGGIFLLLPWLPVYKPVWRASWFSNGQWFVNLITIATVSVIISLSVIAAFFRGPQWQFVWPF
ncbi:hypothetical protein OR1_01595 [Geobacter sp. OR-1]|uniref:selenite/tellurite reduction operon b-type cytochrome membrane protein ExtQ n=1 Tax=Geobacter sp. OR-1 TaxID=1266765 RepID=UPI0005433286|nr:selenite/tellurite reduction operon b-type cytochrome membrane protein ExtQ [Geobacter sp. OR-1]GAM09320.1 hypothetical protein OR1_01595 [Geobacter sp. OR-1]